MSEPVVVPVKPKTKEPKIKPSPKPLPEEWQVPHPSVMPTPKA